MLWHLLGVLEWLAIVAFITGGAGRLLKAKWSAMPDWSLPIIVLALGYLIVFGDQLLLLRTGETTLAAAARVSLWGVLCGSSAIAGHEVIKKLLVQLLSRWLTPEQAEAKAEAILGKLENTVGATGRDA
ncbi:MAG: hypothetical protein NUW01_17000 [Gemmatimonadaceae bacterium]|nr:hypothetical protein [Gemmatimonadaceae bacterium]